MYVCVCVCHLGLLRSPSVGTQVDGGTAPSTLPSIIRGYSQLGGGEGEIDHDAGPGGVTGAPVAMPTSQAPVPITLFTSERSLTVAES